VETGRTIVSDYQKLTNTSDNATVVREILASLWALCLADEEFGHFVKLRTEAGHVLKREFKKLKRRAERDNADGPDIDIDKVMGKPRDSRPQRAED
jgi:hypothetical protein